MCFIAPRWAMVAVVLMALPHWSISRRSVRTTWGDVHSGAAYERAREETERHLQELLELARIRATVVVIVSADPIDAIHRTSEDAAVTFLGFELPPEGEDPATFLEHAEDLLTGLGTVFLVRSTGTVRLEA